MNRTKLKNYAPRARREFIKAVTDRAALFGLTKKEAEPITVEGDVAIIGGNAFPRSVEKKRRRLEETIERDGFDHVMEAAAYTWFNRLLAIRYMELHGYLDHGYRVLSHPEGRDTPEIVQHAEHVNLPGLKTEQIIDLRLDATKEAELYRLLLVAQCNALHKAMPFLFERIDDETELLLPDNLLHSDSLVRQLVQEIPEEDWREVEIIGWLYQFYISEKKAQVIGKVVSSEDIPAATQLFTPNWIVQYLVQNSIGRQWLATYPSSPLRDQMDYYIEPAEQTPEVQAQLDEITPGTLDPERMTLLDPACGSGHILVEAYDLFKAIYLERGYRAREIPRLILRNNLFGLEIDERAAQLASFALLMKARPDDRRVWEGGIRLNVHCIRSSDGLDAEAVYDALSHADVDENDATSEGGGGEFNFMEEIRTPLLAEAKKNRAAVAEDSGGVGGRGGAGFTVEDIRVLLDLFGGEKAKTFGSLIRIPDRLAAKLPEMVERADRVAHGDDFYRRRVAEQFLPVAEQGQVLGQQYDAVVANPPYMGSGYFNNTLKRHTDDAFPDFNGDLFAAFIARGMEMLHAKGALSFITIPTWMFLPTSERMRELLLRKHTFVSIIDNGRGIWGSDFGSCCFTIIAPFIANYRITCKGLSNGKGLVSPLEEIEHSFFERTPLLRRADEFVSVPGIPLSCYLPDELLRLFNDNPSLASIADVRQGLKTGDIDRFVRLWHEVSWGNTHLECRSREESKGLPERWYPCNKGGDYRKWYGNMDYVIDWCRDGERIRNFRNKSGHLKSRPQNLNYLFRRGITWSTVTMGRPSFRLSPQGRLFESGGSTIFPHVGVDVDVILGCLNSVISEMCVEVISPKVSLGEGAVGRIVIPRLSDAQKHEVRECVHELVRLHRQEWAFDETAYAYDRPRLLQYRILEGSVKDAFDWAAEGAIEAVHQVKSTEGRVNATLVEAVGIANHVDAEVRDDAVTLSSCERVVEVCRLISYIIGCLMGRYSLDKPGLIYAHSGSEGFDPSQYQTFPADGDGIVPITDFEWFEDDAANRVVQFIATAWPAEHLEENLEFVADSLERKRGESARDRLRRYLSRQFFKDHLQTYKRRPIYWLFSSGKQRAFQALVYLHRYNESTLSRMRTEYVIPLQGKMANRLEFLQRDATQATSASHRKKVEKEIDALRKQHDELRTFDEKLRHYADKRINLDLDDGVKVNYGKFGDLLAEVKAVTGKKPEVT